MNKKIALGLILLLISSMAPLGATPDESQRLYRMSLDAYLIGKYDQAILLAAQSIREDSESAKARDLLTVLIAEKERAVQTEIWLSSGAPATPVPVAAPVTVDVGRDEIWTELQLIRTELGILKNSRPRDNSRALMQQFEQRVQVVAAVLEKANAGQIEEIRKEQASTKTQLNSMKIGGLTTGIILLGISLLSLILSGLAFWRRNKSVPSGN